MLVSSYCLTMLAQRLLVVALVTCISTVLCYRVPVSFLSLANRRVARLRDQSDEVGNAWLNEDSDEIVVKINTSSARGSPTSTLFDTLYNADDSDSSSAHTIAGLTLREISDGYMFSLNYLGDLVTQMGCEIPVDVDTKVGNILTGEQVHTLLQAVNTLDPFETNAEYETESVWDLCDDLDLSPETLRRMCQQEGIHLPFGMSTMLHASVIEQLRSLAAVEQDHQHGDQQQHTPAEARFTPGEDVIDV